MMAQILDLIGKRKIDRFSWKTLSPNRTHEVANYVIRNQAIRAIQEELITPSEEKQ